MSGIKIEIGRNSEEYGRQQIKVGVDPQAKERWEWMTKDKEDGGGGWKKKELLEEMIRQAHQSMREKK